ncbi:hypothetical protein R1sor_022079 [Riccia sorocarpa]|uniref:Reverse transcriptase domain-containing protein n=1 Tax=Riccia sorocarpa TaxID=122646 RepID=A0ABD3GIU4_9MARC
MGFGSHFILLLKGLVENATSVVHLNGAFTSEVQLQRGVRQGCPIAPMLFTLSTQPLMELLQKAQVRGQLQGLEAGNGMQVLDALFADDTDLLLHADEENWQKATEIIHKFEVMSGARLNVSKSLVIPIGFKEPPDWLRRTGCKLALEGEVWSYLGCPIGIDLSEEQVMQWMLDRMTKRLSHWTNRLLTWESRTVMARHILMAIPTYALMTLGLTTDGYAELARVCSRFIWGANREGADRKAMIAWKKLCGTRNEGGLGLLGFDIQAKALKLKLVTKILNGDDLDWIYLFRSIVEWKVLDTRCRAQEIGCQAENLLITGRKLDLRSTPTAANLLQGWWEVRKFLKLKQDAPLPDDLKIDQVLHLFPDLRNCSEKLHKTSVKLRKKADILVVGDITPASITRLEELDVKGGDMRVTGTMEGPVNYLTWWLRQLGARGHNPTTRLTDPNLWTWRKAGKTFQGWDLLTFQWKQLLGKDLNLHIKLNSVWGLTWDPGRWQLFWQGLWKSELFLRDKTWIWRFMHNGLCVGTRLQKMKVSGGICPWCEEEIESVQHCLLGCGLVNWRWRRLIYLLNYVQPESVSYDNFITFLETALQHQNLRLLMLLLAVAHTRIAWRDRCDRVFKRKATASLALTVITKCIGIGKEATAEHSSGSKCDKIKAGVAYLELMLSEENIERRRREFDAERLEQDAISNEGRSPPMSLAATGLESSGFEYLETDAAAQQRCYGRLIPNKLHTTWEAMKNNLAGRASTECGPM